VLWSARDGMHRFVVPRQGTEIYFGSQQGRRFALPWALFLQPFRLPKF
jgi:hypothetical protein